MKRPRKSNICPRGGIKIAGMEVGRKEKHGRSCAALSLDDPVPERVLAEMRACTGGQEKRPYSSATSASTMSFSDSTRGETEQAELKM